MKINKFFCSESVSFFKSRIEHIYGWECINESSNYNKDEPVIFLGMYREQDFQRIYNHKGLAIIIWCGCDILGSGKLINHNSYRHIAVAKESCNILNTSGKKAIHIPMTFEFLDKFKPVKLGDKVYCYAPNDNYNLTLCREVLDSVPFEYELTVTTKQYTTEQLDEIYSKCFVGVRLRNYYDGNSATVQGMSFKGICSVWNGENPYAISWKTNADVVCAIMEESKKIGTIQNEVSEKSIKFYSDVVDRIKSDNFWEEK